VSAPLSGIVNSASSIAIRIAALIAGAGIGTAMFYRTGAKLACALAWPQTYLCEMPALLYAAPVGAVVGAVVGWVVAAQWLRSRDAR
jgi:hypothetical protein